MQQVKELTGGTDLDAVIVPIGGGGLISGVATAVKSLCPGIRVIGAEPQKAADAFRSKQVHKQSSVRVQEFVVEIDVDRQTFILSVCIQEVLQQRTTVSQETVSDSSKLRR